QLLDRVRRLEQTLTDLRYTVERLTKRLEEGAVPQASAAAPAVAQKAIEIEAAPPVRPAVPITPPPARAVPVTPPVAPPVPPAMPPRPPRQAAPEPARPRRSFDWEALIGVKFFAIVASLAPLLAGGFLVSH